MTAPHCTVFETAMGFCAIAWNTRGILRFRLPYATAEDANRQLLKRLPDAEICETPPQNIADIIADAQRYFAGERIDFSAVALDLDGEGDLFRQIYAATRRVGYGQTTTYGALAKLTGTGWEAARDVGQAMAKNPVPLIIPCHRVLAAGGKTGGFSAPGGVDTKRRMLELEGVTLDPPRAAQPTLGL